MADDLRAVRAAGASEVLLSLDGDHDLDTTLDAHATLAPAVEPRVGV